MPQWLIGLLVSMAVNLIERYGIPAVEQRFPYLIPIIDEIIGVIGGGPSSANLQASADHFNALSSSSSPGPVAKT